MKKLKVCFIISCLLLCLAQKNSASDIYGGEITYTHVNSASDIYGGEITYTHVTGLSYQIDITLYTGFFGDRPTIDSVHIGGVTRTFNRDLYIDYPVLGIRKSIYSEIHTFSGPGTYSISFILPTRKGNIANIPNSFFTPFSIRSELIIDQYCPNTSVNFGDMPVFFSQRNRVYIHQPAILNPDHDSLSFELDTCLGEYGIAIPGYSFPPGFSIDPVSGEISSGGFPDSICTYALAIKISEWKNGTQCGSVIRDFNITVHPDTFDAYWFNPPILQVDSGGNYFQTLNPGDSLPFSIQYYDSSTSPVLTAFGEAFSVGNPSTVIIDSVFANSVTAHLSWVPDSTLSRPYPYIFTFRGSNDIQKTDLTILVYINGSKPDSCYTAPIGIEEISNDNGFTLYPNPTSGQFTMESKKFPIDQIEIYDLLGDNIHSSTTNCASCLVNCAFLSPGIYFVKATVGDKIFYKKIIKE